MKFVLFVEGTTERDAVRDFLSRWLNPRLAHRVGIDMVKFVGSAQMVKDLSGRVRKLLNDSAEEKEIIAVIALLDLYGLKLPYPSSKRTASQRYEWAKNYLEKQVKQDRFRQFFAVHETEAWLLSDPTIFPMEFLKTLIDRCREPESINFDRPPAKLLSELYQSRFKRSYGKVKDGTTLFAKLDPSVAYEKCPYLQAMLDKMLRLTQEAGL